MKKVLLFCAAAAALLLAASCNKGGDNNKVVLPAAKYTEQAKKLNLLNSDSNPGIKSIEFTESGRYIICMQVFETGPLAVKAVADSKIVYKHGTYSVNNNVYTLSGSFNGTVTVIGGQITIQTSEDTIVLNYEEAEKYPANEFYTTVARSWNVDKTDISVNFDGKSAVGVVKNGCDIPAILKELEQKANVDLKDEEFSGYVVSEINFTLSKTMEVAFTQKDPIAGPISFSENGDVSYTLNGSNGVEILSGSATGSFDLNPGLGTNQVMLSLNTEITTKSGKTYTGRVSFILSPKA